MKCWGTNPFRDFSMKVSLKETDLTLLIFRVLFYVRVGVLLITLSHMTPYRGGVKLECKEEGNESWERLGQS